MPTYDPSKVSITVVSNSNGSGTIVAKGESTFCSAARNNDGVTLKMGADGYGTRNLNKDRSGKITLTLLADSPSNDFLDSLATADEADGTGLCSVLVADNNNTNARAHCESAWVNKIPDLERAKESGEVTWVFETYYLDLHQGARIPDADGS